MGKSRRNDLKHLPKTDRDKAFCEAWLTHFDQAKAWAEAGYSTKAKNHKQRATAKLRRFMPYLEPIRKAKAEEVGKQLAMRDGDVLSTMRRVAYADPADFFVLSDQQVMREEPDPEKGEKAMKLVPVTYQGKPVFHVIPKPLHDLTAEQRQAVEVMTAFGGYAGYKLASHKTKHSYLESLGKNLGLWLEETAKEQHTHLHRHAHLHVDDVPTEQLIELQRQFIRVVGAEQARNLGLSQKEIEEAMVVEFKPRPKRLTRQA